MTPFDDDERNEELSPRGHALVTAFVILSVALGVAFCLVSLTGWRP